MASINVKSNIKEVSRGLSKFHRKQIPFATSQAINDTAFDVRKEHQKQLPNYIDRPTPFTKRGVKVKKSNKRDLVGVVYFDKIQAKYMKLQIKGGTRRPDNKVLLVPTAATKLNQYGNISKAVRNRMFSNRTKYYSTSAGIFERYGPGLLLSRMVARYVKSATYKPLYPFDTISKNKAGAVFSKRFEVRLAQAIKSAK